MSNHTVGDDFFSIIGYPILGRSLELGKDWPNFKLGNCFKEWVRLRSVNMFNLIFNIIFPVIIIIILFEL
jgi:hypothetical protein